MDRDFSSDFTFTSSRSSGPGGQNVNKVNSKVMLCFDVNNSTLLTDDEKNLINRKLANRINSEGILQVTSQSERTQLANKEKAIQKFYQIIEKALTIPKPRKKTKPSKAAIKKRLENKRRLAQKKETRRKIE